MFETFTQNYTPLGNEYISALGNEYVSAIFAAIPVLVLLLMLGVFRTAAHWAALGGLVASLLVAVLFYGMPAGLALSAGLNEAVFGLWPAVPTS